GFIWQCRHRRGGISRDWLLCLGDVVDHCIAGAEFGAVASWYLFRYLMYRYRGRGGGAADHRWFGGNCRTSLRDVVLIADAGLYFKCGCLGKAAGNERQGREVEGAGEVKGGGVKKFKG